VRSVNLEFTGNSPVDRLVANIEQFCKTACFENIERVHITYTWLDILATILPEDRRIRVSEEIGERLVKTLTSGVSEYNSTCKLYTGELNAVNRLTGIRELLAFMSKRSRGNPTLPRDIFSLVKQFLYA